jgi:hypothetical protein
MRILYSQMPLFKKKINLKDFKYIQDKALKEPLYSVEKLNQPNYNFNNNLFYHKITWNQGVRMPNIHTNQLYLFDNGSGNPFLFTLERISIFTVSLCFINKKSKKKLCVVVLFKDLSNQYKSIWEINEAVPLYHMNYDIVKMRLDLVEHISSVLNNRYNSAVLRAEYPPNYNSPSTPLPPNYSSPAPKYSSPAPIYRLTPPSSPVDEDGLPAVSPRSNITNEGGRKKTRRITKKIKRKATRRRKLSRKNRL